MIDASIIQQRYLSMSDEQLIAFALNEGHQITFDAFQLLREEFARRNMDFAPLETSEENKKLRQEQQFQKVQESGADVFLDSIWDYALDEKRQLTSNAEIIAGLKQRGLDDARAAIIMAGLYGKAKKLLSDSVSQTWTGGIVSAVGMLITLGTYSAAASGGGYIVAWGAIVFGLIRFLKGNAAQDKYKAIIDAIEAERLYQTETVSD